MTPGQVLNSAPNSCSGLMNVGSGRAVRSLLWPQGPGTRVHVGVDAGDGCPAPRRAPWGRGDYGWCKGSLHRLIQCDRPRISDSGPDNL